MAKNKNQTPSTTSADIVASMPAYLDNATPAQIPAFMPGQLDFLSKDLSAGFGPTPKAFADYLRQINQPAQTMNYGTAKTAPKTPTAPKKPDAAGLAGLNDPNRMVLINGQLKPAWMTSRQPWPGTR